MEDISPETPQPYCSILFLTSSNPVWKTCFSVSEQEPMNFSVHATDSFLLLHHSADFWSVDGLIFAAQSAKALISQAPYALLTTAEKTKAANIKVNVAIMESKYKFYIPEMLVTCP
jgi:hypothetical protein